MGFKVSILSPSPFFCIKMKHLFKCQALFLAEEGGEIYGWGAPEGRELRGAESFTGSIVCANETRP